MSKYIRGKPRYVTYRGKVWIDTGYIDDLGRSSLWSLSKDGEGVSVKDPIPVTGSELEACIRIWGELVGGPPGFQD